MSNARGVIKTPVFLKRFMHQPWHGAFKKWKGAATTQEIAMYLAKAGDKDASIIIKRIVECEQFPTPSMINICRLYRINKMAIAAAVRRGMSKGSSNKMAIDAASVLVEPKKNVMAIDAASVLVEQSLDSTLSAPIDVASVVDKHPEDVDDKHSENVD